jgi:hypothetical protein
LSSNVIKEWTGMLMSRAIGMAAVTVMEMAATRAALLGMTASKRGSELMERTPLGRSGGPGKAAKEASVLSIHRTSDGLVRYTRWPNGRFTVELLRAVGTVTTGGPPSPGEGLDNPSDGQDAPPDAMEPAPATTWQICAIVGARRR